VVCITSLGQSIRIPVRDISIQKAYASGVCITKLKEGDTIVAIAKTEADRNGEDENSEGEQETEE